MLRWMCAALAASSLMAGGLGWGSAAAARPYTVDDLLSQESFGAAAFDPQGRWAVFERRDRYDRAGRYDRGLNTGVTLSRLWVTDVRRPGPARPLVTDPAARGLVMAAFSPGGDRLAVYGWRDGVWSLGIVEMASGALRWLAVAPDWQYQGRTLQWLSDTRLLVTALPQGQEPWRIARGHAAADRLPKRWAAAARGDASVTAIGGGAYASLRPRPDAARLLRIDLTGREPAVLASGEILDFEASPDRRRVAVIEAGPDVPVRADLPVQGPTGLAAQAGRLSLIDLSTGAGQAVCAACDMLGGLLAWSPSSRALLVFARGADGTWPHGELLRVDADAATVAAAAPGLEPQVDLRPERLRVGWLGEDIVVRVAADRTRPEGQAWRRVRPDATTAKAPAGALRASARDGAIVFQGGAAALWRRAGGTRPLPTAGRLTPLSIGRSGRLSELPAESWAVMARGASRAVVRVDASGLQAVATAGEGELTAASAAAGAVLRRVRDDHGAEALWLDRQGQAPVRVADINGFLEEVDALRPIPIRHKDAAGQARTSWLYRPLCAAGPPPLVIRPYPGDVYDTPPRLRGYDDGITMADIRTLVGHGYAVLAPSLPRGPEPDGPMAGIASRLLAIEAAARADPALAGAYDPDRVAILGWSFGGYATLSAITQTDRFRAAVALAGVSDPVAMWAKTQLLTRVAPEQGIMSTWSAGNWEEGQGRFGGPPWARPDLYRVASPLMAADRIRTPLMLVTGDLDFAEQSEAMFSALWRQGKDVQLITYGGEVHSILSPANVRDLHARIFAFLDERLGVTPQARCAARGASPAPGPASDGPRPPSPPARGAGSAAPPRSAAPPTGPRPGDPG